jgi:hypothetical protein
MKDSWTEKQLKFIEWLSLPRYARTPPTQEMFAETIGVSDLTLWRWKKLDGFQESVNALARQTVGAKLPEVYGALLREAEKGSFPHIKLALELSGDYVEKSETRGEIKLKVEYGDDGTNDTST